MREPDAAMLLSAPRNPSRRRFAGFRYEVYDTYSLCASICDGVYAGTAQLTARVEMDMYFKLRD